MSVYEYRYGPIIPFGTCYHVSTLKIVATLLTIVHTVVLSLEIRLLLSIGPGLLIH